MKVWGFGDIQTNGRTDIGDCRVAFVTDIFSHTCLQHVKGAKNILLPVTVMTELIVEVYCDPPTCWPGCSSPETVTETRETR